MNGPTAATGEPPAQFEDGIEWYTYNFHGEEESAPGCARCGSDCDWQDCWNCGGEGEVEDTRDWSLGGLLEMYMPCDWCRGEGGWWRCISGSEWCEANPLPGREHVQSSARSKEEADDD